MPTERQAYFLGRLEQRVANAEARYARAEERVLAAREAGRDTSIASPVTPGTTPDFALRKLAAQVQQAKKELDTYRAKIKET